MPQRELTANEWPARTANWNKRAVGSCFFHFAHEPFAVPDYQSSQDRAKPGTLGRTQNRPGAYTQVCCDAVPAPAFSAEVGKSFHVQRCSRPPDSLALGSCVLQAGLHALLNQGPLKLGILRRTAIRRLCGARDYAKPQHRGGTVACISVMWGFA